MAGVICSARGTATPQRRGPGSPMAGNRIRNLLDYLCRRVAPAEGAAVTDAQLLERYAVGGDEAAFELLAWRHGPMVLGVCRRVLGDADEADDAFQATFLVLARKAPA